ncbi:hypothetical protein M2341_001359 [Sphingobium sp. B7D2B]|uniref:hypothetical protein n=1 Tax=Sphingobium sp. B7D2B TaxID=2940583 RepID=UPI0022252BAB|nr:hypothetical protein [Sphingobium sp. B7D2B]MCW2365912.1 hypothetical protein [Sphingobium sp. B7D2B]
MHIRTNRSTPLEDGRDVIITLRSRAEDIAERGLARATTLADEAGRRASRLGKDTARKVSKGSKSLVENVRDHVPGMKPSGLAASQAARFVRRHPALLVAVGLTAATVGYLAWRAQRDTEESDDYSEG